jgi:hypothetical protein
MIFHAVAQKISITVDLQFFSDICFMHFYRFDGNEQFFGNVPVVVAQSDERQHLFFPFRKTGVEAVAFKGIQLIQLSFV